MPMKTNRIKSFFVILFFVLGLGALPVDRLMGQDTTAPVKKAGSLSIKRSLTPEERAAEKQKALEFQNQMATKRMQSFGMLPANDDSEVGKKYQAAFNQFREAAVGLNHVKLNYHLAENPSSSFRDNVYQEWQDGIHQGFLAKANWLKVASETYESDPDKYTFIGESLGEMMLHDVELDRLDGWLEAAQAVVRAKKIETQEILRAAGLIGYSNSDFDFTEECLARTVALDNGLDAKPDFLAEIKIVREKWQRELEIRQREAQKNDNPRVEFLTTKGKMVLELYEDSAPETVKSFIYLVEKGFYDRKSFFRVEKHFCAQTGCEKGDGTGDAGYTIPSEVDRADRRDHFRGSMGMALGSDPKTGQVRAETGSSQFYFTFLPTPRMDGRHTVFGRVVESQETMSFFRVMNLGEEAQRKEGKQPDLIISAKVLRKRDTVYKPTIIAGKLPK